MGRFKYSLRTLLAAIAAVGIGAALLGRRDVVASGLHRGPDPHLGSGFSGDFERQLLSSFSKTQKAIG
jgi:hypothetical protein